MCWVSGIYLLVSKLTICFAANFITISSRMFGLICFPIKRVEYLSLFKNAFFKLSITSTSQFNSRMYIKSIHHTLFDSKADHIPINTPSIM